MDNLNNNKIDLFKINKIFNDYSPISAIDCGEINPIRRKYTPSYMINDYIIQLDKAAYKLKKETNIPNVQNSYAILSELLITLGNDEDLSFKIEEEIARILKDFDRGMAQDPERPEITMNGTFI